MANDEAMKKKIAIGKDAGRGHKKVVEILPQPLTSNDNSILKKEGPTHRTTSESIKEHEEKKARDKAAELVGANPRYVSDARRIQKTHPEKFKEIASGKRQCPRGLGKVRPETSNQLRTIQGLWTSFIVWQGGNGLCA
jgi:hypothetical protein